MKNKSKFQKGDIVEANRSGSLAIILEVCQFTYKVKYNEKYNCEMEYLIAEFDNYWDLKSRNAQYQLDRQCTCGIWKTYGKNINSSFHSSYCDLISK